LRIAARGRRKIDRSKIGYAAHVDRLRPGRLGEPGSCTMLAAFAIVQARASAAKLINGRFNIGNGLCVGHRVFRWKAKA
jgi:hypothetical protein